MSNARFKRLCTTLATSGMVAVLAACGGGGNSGNGGTGTGAKGPQNPLTRCPQSTNTTAASAESGDVTINVSGFASSPAEDALVQQGLNGFMSANPHIKVTWNPIPGDYPTKMRANIASGNSPDVFYVQPPMGQEYIPAGKLLNLGPYMQRDNVDPNSFYKALAQPFDCADGTVFGISKDWNALGLFYNKSMFQAANIPAPTADWTWTDLQSAAQKLTKADGSVYGASLPSDASRFGAFLFANGGSMLSSDGKTATFNNQAGIDAAKFYTSFHTNKTGVTPKDVGAGWDGEAFGKGEVAMTFEGGWMIPFMTKTYPDLQYGIAPLPKALNGQRSNLVYTNAWGAYSGTKHPDAAWKVIQYMTGATYQALVLHAGFALPSIQTLSSDPYFQQNPGVQVLLDGAQNSHADFYGAADTEVHNDLGNALDEVILKNTPVDKALNDAATKVNVYIQQNTAQ